MSGRRRNEFQTGYIRIGWNETYFLGDRALSRLALALCFINGADVRDRGGVIRRLMSARPGRGRGRLNIRAGLGDVALKRLLSMTDIGEQL